MIVLVFVLITMVGVVMLGDSIGGYGLGHDDHYGVDNVNL